MSAQLPGKPRFDSISLVSFSFDQATNHFMARFQYQRSKSTETYGSLIVEGQHPLFSEMTLEKLHQFIIGAEQEMATKLTQTTPQESTHGDRSVGLNEETTDAPQL